MVSFAARTGECAGERNEYVEELRNIKVRVFFPVFGSIRSVTRWVSSQSRAVRSTSSDVGFLSANCWRTATLARLNGVSQRASIARHNFQWVNEKERPSLMRLAMRLMSSLISSDWVADEAKSNFAFRDSL